MDQPVRLRIDFVSDIACPWCAIGLASLTLALASLAPRVTADIRLQPFELNPGLPAEGEDAGEHLMRKYAIGEAQLEANRKAIRQRAAPLGVVINSGPGSRAWNTFDAHRLLHWATQEDPARALAVNEALFRAYFTDNANVSDHAVLVDIARHCGLDADAALRMLASGELAGAVRSQERHWQQAGIHSVPATIVNGQYLIAGGQPPASFARTLAEIARAG